jgi:hypothetical protein
VCTANDRHLTGMKFDSRFEVRLQAHQRDELQELANDAGMSVAAITRLAVKRLLRDREALLHEGKRKEARA